MNSVKWFLVISATLLIVSGCTTYSPRTSQNSAVASLIDQALIEHRDADYARASTTLERALRIEPRNPLLWQKLAAIRIDQQQYEQAENLAKKSNALSQGDRDLRRENWQLISKARSMKGDNTGADEARQRAASE